MREYARIPTSWATKGAGRALRGDAVGLALAGHLRVCPASSMIGIFHLALPTLAHELGLEVADVRAALARAATKGAIHYDEAAELVYVPDMAADEIGRALPADDRRRRAVVRLLEQVGDHPFRRMFLLRYGAAYALPFDAPSEAHPGTLDGSSMVHPRTFEAPSMPQCQDQDQDQDQGQKQISLSAGARGEQAQGQATTPQTPESGRSADPPSAGVPSGESAAIERSTAPASAPPERTVEPDPVPAEEPSPLVSLARRRPGDDLLSLLLTLVGEGLPWAVAVGARVAERGGALSDAERRRLREIRAERAARAAAPAARASPRGAPSALQRAAAPGQHEYPLGKEL